MGLVKNALVFGAGYVAGTAAGRGRYEQIKRKAGELVHRPEVQQATARAKDTARRKVLKKTTSSDSTDSGSTDSGSTTGSGGTPSAVSGPPSPARSRRLLRRGRPAPVTVPSPPPTLP